MESEAAKQWSRTFPRTPESVAAARRFVRDTLNQAGTMADLDVVVLCTSELVTNAIAHTRGDRFDVEIVSAAGGIGVSVFDSEPAAPTNWKLARATCMDVASPLSRSSRADGAWIRREGGQARMVQARGPATPLIKLMEMTSEESSRKSEVESAAWRFMTQ